MIQEEIDRFLSSPLGAQLTEVFVTSDDRIFIRVEDAYLHRSGKLEAGTNPLINQSIETWVPSWLLQHGDVKPEQESRKIIKCWGETLFVFNSFEHWVNKASSRLGGVKKSGQVLLCLDKDGYTCNIGADFMESRDSDRFPVTAYVLTRSVNKEK